MAVVSLEPSHHVTVSAGHHTAQHSKHGCVMDCAIARSYDNSPIRCVVLNRNSLHHLASNGGVMQRLPKVGGLQWMLNDAQLVDATQFEAKQQEAKQQEPNCQLQLCRPKPLLLHFKTCVCLPLR